jgi:L-ascorbate metabolism protein UlaG (beta-lactamase superfamily)
MANQIRWLGNAGFEFQLGKATLIVDPFLTRPNIMQTYFGRVEPDEAALQEHIPNCDHILVTHAHFDHCMDAPAVAQRTGAIVHGSANTCRLMQAAGLPASQTHEIHAGDKFEISGVHVQVLPSVHPWLPGYTYGDLKSSLKFPLHLRDYQMDTCYSYLMEFKGTRLLVWSSTQPDDAPRADLLTCRAVSSQRWYNLLLGQVQPSLAIPQHWDDTFQPLSDDPQPFFSAPRLALPPVRRIDLEEFSAHVRLAASDCAVLLPKIFKSYDIAPYLR